MIVEYPLDNRLTVSNDRTYEEVALLGLVKQRMLQKLDDRRKFIFVYIFELGNTQKETAEVLGVDESSISRHMKIIRETLAPFK